VLDKKVAANSRLEHINELCAQRGENRDDLIRKN